MSAKQSNLSAPKFGYDLVVATTQDSINATMKQFLSAYEGKELIACYVYDKAAKTVKLIEYETLKQMIGGIDPFEIPANEDPESDRLSKLFHLKFKFGFKAKIGLPNGLAPTDIPEVVVLDQGNSRVSYQLFFQEFTVIALEEDFGDLTWNNLTQPDDAPWMFRFSVNLDLKSGDFNALPQSVQDKVRNLNPDSAFSVQQLYLDLNTAGLQTNPAIAGLDKSSDTYTYLTRIFLNTYWDRLKASGDVMLGYTVKPVTPNPRYPSIVPTDMTIEVSPHRDPQGNPTQQYGLYTLDYLVMSDNRVLPSAVQFDWNWIDATEEADYHGCMAVKKARFAQYLNQLFSPQLNRICLIPNCNVWYDWGKASVMYHYGYSGEKNSQSYRLIEDGSSHVLSFSYSKEASDYTGAKGAPAGRLHLVNTTTSDVYLENNIIRTVTTFTGYVDLEIMGGEAEGNFVKYQVETSYQINVDQNGALVVSLVPGSPNVTDLSDRINPDGWSKFVTFGSINGIVSEIKRFLSDISTFLTGHDQRILQVLNGSAGWVFPGGKTFAFKDVYFSDHQDLVTHVTYVDPT